MKSGVPIDPTQVSTKKLEAVPAEVIDAFNELIVQNMDTKGHAEIFQHEVVKLIKLKMPNISSAEIYKNHWLDVEEIFRGAGWKVTYDKPAYCESYDAYFIFSK